jgi:hypothetical protein
MTIKHSLNFFLCLGTFYSASSQNLPQQVTVDNYLRLTFPGKVTHFDSLGAAVFQTTVDNTTYQVVKREKIFEEASEEKRGELMDQGAHQVMANAKFDGLAKQVRDSVIGGSVGRFIRIMRTDPANPYFVFVFMTFQGRNMYMVQCTSFKPAASALQDARNYYGRVVFQALQRVPVPQPH